MKYHVLAAVCLMAVLTAPSFAQTYTIEWVDPSPMYSSENVGIAKRTGYMRNMTSSTKNILFRYDLSQMNPAHSPSFCFGDNCFYLFPGEDNPWERPEQVLAGNGTFTLYADLGPNKVQGQSSVSYKLFDKTDTTLDVSFTCTYIFGPTSVLPEASELGFSVGPNPSTDIVTISGGSVNIIGLNLYSSQGTLMRTYGVVDGSSHTISVADLSSGLYHLILTLADGNVVRTGITVYR